MSTGLRKHLPISAVNLVGCELVEIDIVEATQIDSTHVFSVRGRSVTERMNSTRRTENVVGDFLVELVIAQYVFAGDQLELARGDERQHIARFRTNRAIARDCLFEAHGHFVAYGTAMAAAGTGFDFGEVFVRLHGGSVAQVRRDGKWC